MFSVGDKVSIDDAKYPGVWTVRSLGPVNAVLEPAHGGRPLRVPQTMLIAPGAAVTPTETTIFSPGEFMQITGKHGGLYVVIRDNGGDTISLARAGGDNGRYLRISRRGLKAIDASDVLK